MKKIVFLFENGNIILLHIGTTAVKTFFDQTTISVSLRERIASRNKLGSFCFQFTVKDENGVRGEAEGIIEHSNRKNHLKLS